jgi:hypothetical protein
LYCYSLFRGALIQRAEITPFEPDPGSAGEGKKSFLNQPSSIKPLLLVAERFKNENMQKVLAAILSSYSYQQIIYNH